jgi:dTDP-4-dehydrorhamnose 3,5-epimerase
VQLHPTPFAGAFVVTPDPIRDDRGSFGRLFDAEVFAVNGLDPFLAQSNYSHNLLRGTLRGLHFQRAPWGEAKLVRCTRGRVFDVIVDLRASSATRCEWFGTVLDDESRNAIYLPAGFAHGFLTLTDDTELHYQMSVPFRPESSDGVRWNDPAFGIDWPFPPAVISDRDATYPWLDE